MLRLDRRQAVTCLIQAPQQVGHLRPEDARQGHVTRYLIGPTRFDRQVTGWLTDRLTSLQPVDLLQG